MTKLPKPMSTPIVVKVVRVTGTIRKAEEEIIRRAKEIILRAKTAEDGAGDADIVQEITKAVDKRRETEALVIIDENDNSDASESE